MSSFVPSKSHLQHSLLFLLHQKKKAVEAKKTLNVTRGAICQRLKAMEKIQQYGKWVPHQLNDRQMENRKTICEMLLQRFERKSFLHRIVTGEEKWIYFENPKRKKSWLSAGEVGPSTARPNRFGRKTMLCV